MEDLMSQQKIQMPAFFAHSMMLSILHAPTEMIHPDLLNIMDESDVDSVAPGDTIHLQDQEYDTSINHNEK